MRDITSPKDKEVSHFLSIKSLHIATTPAPSLYNIKSEFSSTPVSKAISFGIAREAYSKVYIKESPPIDKSIPGPGQYVVPPKIGDAQKYTMRPKTINPCNDLTYSYVFVESMTTIRINPGPGAYEMKPALNQNGAYFNSKYHNSMATTMAPSRSLRFLELKNSPEKLNPGPGRYTPMGEMTKQGSYFVSKF